MSLLLIALVSLLSCLAQLCQKQAATLGARHGKSRLMLWIGLSLLLLGVAMLLWLWVLRRVPVSVAIRCSALTLCWWRSPRGSSGRKATPCGSGSARWRLWRAWR